MVKRCGTICCYAKATDINQVKQGSQTTYAQRERFIAPEVRMGGNNAVDETMVSPGHLVSHEVGLSVTNLQLLLEGGLSAWSPQPSGYQY